MAFVKPEGPANARIMLVGEAPGVEEEAAGRPFIGASGWCLTKMLEDAGIARNEVFITNLCYERPPNNDITAWISERKTQPSPEWTRLRGKWVAPQVQRGYKELTQQIAEVKPNIIIAAGNSAMWALTGRSGIMHWRGSQLRTDSMDGGIQCIPVIHPAAVLREWKFRQITVHDLRRAARWRTSQWPTPEYQFHVRPDFSTVRAILGRLYDRLLSGERLRIAFDIETRLGHIACAGLAWSKQEALCVPFTTDQNQAGYWTEDQELEVIRLLCLVLTAPSVRVVGQNIIYDCQYTWKHWGFVPRVEMDTMIAQHACFSDLPKSLLFLSSMYCNYHYNWKAAE